MGIVSHGSETLAQGLQVITSCAFIWDKKEGEYRVFLPQRASTKKFLPDVYELPGGHIDFGEDIVKGLKREIQEEFQMEISVGDPFYVFTYKNPIKKSHSIEVVYFAQFASPEKSLTLQSQDHQGYTWANKDQAVRLNTAEKLPNDPEVQALRKGFNLLNQIGLQFR